MAHPNSKRAKAAKAQRARARADSNIEDRTWADETRAVRVDQREAVRRGRGRRTTQRKVRNTAGIATLVLLVAFGLWNVFKPGPELAGVEKVSNQGRGHVENASFNDPAPTSGNHSPSGTRCGTFTTPLPLELAVHALEHGTVVLWYAFDRPELAAELIAATSEFDSHVIISPNDGIDSPIVATAWNRKKSYESVNADLVDFVEIYRERGPESVPCDR